MQRHAGREMWDVDECQSPRMGSVILGAAPATPFASASPQPCPSTTHSRFSPAQSPAAPTTTPSEVIRKSILLILPMGRWTYEDPSWARIAELLPVVVQSAEGGDEVANKILHKSVGELASSVNAVVQRLELGGEGDTPIFLTVFLITFEVQYFCKKNRAVRVVADTLFTTDQTITPAN